MYVFLQLPLGSLKCQQWKRAADLKRQLSRDQAVDLKILFHVNFSKAHIHNHMITRPDKNLTSKSGDAVPSSDTSEQEAIDNRGKIVFCIDQEATEGPSESLDETFNVTSPCGTGNSEYSTGEDDVDYEADLPNDNNTSDNSTLSLSNKHQTVVDRSDEDLKNDCQDLLTVAWDATRRSVDRERLVLAKQKLKEVVAILNGSSFDGDVNSSILTGESKSASDAYLTTSCDGTRNSSSSGTEVSPSVHLTVDLESTFEFPVVNNLGMAGDATKSISL